MNGHHSDIKHHATAGKTSRQTSNSTDISLEDLSVFAVEQTHREELSQSDRMLLNSDFLNAGPEVIES